MVMKTWNKGGVRSAWQLASIMLNSKRALAALLLIGCLDSARAVSISYDEILFPSDVDPAFLSGTVGMTLSGSTLTIVLKNTSADAAGSGAGILLAGLGFNLPSELAITGGNADMGASSAVNFVKPSDGNVSQEWGYDTPPINSGVLMNAVNPVNAGVSSMQSQMEAQFQSGSLVPPDGSADGPDMGLVSALELDPLGLGVEAINDTVTITLNLSGSYTGDLLSFIDSHGVVLTFGSPEGVPDPSGTIVLLGISLFGVEGLRRRFARV